MTNVQISDTFSLLAKLMDIHGENSFKSKSYSSVAFAIDKLPMQLSETDAEKIASIKGIGASSAKKIIELLESGTLRQLDEIIFLTPPGVSEMLNIKGLGPKKINTIWKEMELESIGELLYACKENRLKLYKGFGEKTQQTVIDNIEFYSKNKGNYLYSQTISIAKQLKDLLENLFTDKTVFITGDFARQSEIITQLEFIIDEAINNVEHKILSENNFALLERNADSLLFKTSAGINIKIYSCGEKIIEKLIETSSSPEFFAALKSKSNNFSSAKDETEYFQSINQPFIPSFLREYPQMLEGTIDFSGIIAPNDVKGLIHCHSTWSDGNNSIEEMAAACIAKGLEYMAISDHSKSAFYAKGLFEEQIKTQHDQIDELNIKLAPFKIFKSIESDILNDGNLDYSNSILSTFDLVIASVHSNLKMTEEKAMKRLIAAIENPYTTILGHMTGRLLLSRPGYPLDFHRIIDGCAQNNVVIELNANPNRLDMDWRHIQYALQKNVLISVDPDAHSIKGIDDIQYGVFAAQKGMLKKQNNLSSFSLSAFEHFILDRKKIKNI
jgi:DNA polymerase (family X)